MTETAETEKNYTPLEVAEIMQVSRQTVYNWINRGTLKAFKAGHSVRISESELKKMKNPKN